MMGQTVNFERTGVRVVHCDLADYCTYYELCIMT